MITYQATSSASLLSESQQSSVEKLILFESLHGGDYFDWNRLLTWVVFEKVGPMNIKPEVIGALNVADLFAEEFQFTDCEKKDRV